MGGKLAYQRLGEPSPLAKADVRRLKGLGATLALDGRSEHHYSTEEWNALLDIAMGEAKDSV